MGHGITRRRFPKSLRCFLDDMLRPIGEIFLFRTKAGNQQTDYRSRSRAASIVRERPLGLNVTHTLKMHSGDIFVRTFFLYMYCELWRLSAEEKSGKQRCVLITSASSCSKTFSGVERYRETHSALLVMLSFTLHLHHRKTVQKSWFTAKSLQPAHNVIQELSQSIVSWISSQHHNYVQLWMSLCVIIGRRILLLV